ncbi:MAG: hypothetical protein DMF64_17330 [Acidobacteria bacterium]|nr:MAG: hypothetical protein DMF64_17330 [Acidobacteriota bacterium]
MRDAAEQYDDARRLLHEQPPGSGILLPLLNTTAVVVELFLKSLSSKLVHVPVDDFDGLSRVYAEPKLKNHRLVELLDKIPDDVRTLLESSFAADPSFQAEGSLRDTLAKYEGLFEASRYPFEARFDITKYLLTPLMALAEFLRTFVANMEPTGRIEW